MRDVVILMICVLGAFSCKAQSPVIPLFDGSDYLGTENAYYKDTENDFDRFVGTWKFTEGDQEFEIVLRKKQQHMFSYANKTFYEDMMYGEYKYVDENGNTLVNSLSNIDNPTIDVSQHLIFGNTILHYKSLPPCEDCQPDERRVSLRLKDEQRSYLMTNIVLRTVPSQTNINAQDLELTLTLSYSIFPEGAPTLPRILEYRTIYRLIKQ